MMTDGFGLAKLAKKHLLLQQHTLEMAHTQRQAAVRNAAGQATWFASAAALSADSNSLTLRAETAPRE